MKDCTISLIDTMLAKSPALTGERQNLIDATERICRCFAEGHHLYICGNGGSASDAEHIVGEFVKAFRKMRTIFDADKARFAAAYPEDATLLDHIQVGFPAHSLVSGTAIITAIINDLGGEYVYAQQANAYIQPGDILIGISTSGNSVPVQYAMKIASFKGGNTIAMTGKSGGKMADIADLTLRSVEQETYLVQQDHIALYHIVCAAVEEELT
jgi:D-sedoheptulose 7-phosphate isomerase